MREVCVLDPESKLDGMCSQVSSDRECVMPSHQLKNYKLSEKAEVICSQLADRIVKSMLLPMLRRLAYSMLTGLHRLFRTRGHNTSLGDPAFSIVFLCLIVIGSI
jgi:hypothetical protein